MDVHPEGQVCCVYVGGLKEAQEELDQVRVTVDERDLLTFPVGLALRALAPVGDGARDKELAVGKGAYLRGGRLALGGPSCIPKWLLSMPVLAGCSDGLTFEPEFPGAGDGRPTGRFDEVSGGWLDMRRPGP